MTQRLFTLVLVLWIFLCGRTGVWSQDSGAAAEEVVWAEKVSSAQGREKIAQILDYLKKYPGANPQRIMDWTREGLLWLEGHPDLILEIKLLDPLAAALSKLGKPAEAIETAKKGLTLAERSGSGDLSAQMQVRLGNAFFYYSSYPKALEYYQRALAFYKKEGNVLQYYRLLCNIGNCHLRAGDRIKALEYLLLALKLAEKRDSSQEYANILNSLGVLYLESKDYQNAEKYFSLYMPVALKMGNPDQISAGYNNLGFLFRRRKNSAQALHYFQKALEVKEASGAPLNKGPTLLNIGEVYLYTGQPEKAAVYFKEAIRFCEVSGDKRYLANGCLNMARVRLYMGRAVGMKEYIDRARETAREIKSNEQEAQCCELSASYYIMIGAHRAALTAMESAAEFRNRVHNESINRRVAELQSIYLVNKKEQEIELLNKEKAIGQLELQTAAAQKTLLIGMLAILIVLVLLLVNRYRLKNRAHREIEAKNLELTRAYGELAAAHEEISALGGLLPICAVCKSIRDDQGYWRQVEVYIRQHSQADFSHSICPVCAEKLYPGLEEGGALAAPERTLSN